MFPMNPGAYLTTHESQNFGGGAPEKGTTAKFTDFDKYIVYSRVIDPAESKSGIIIGFGLLLHLGYFCPKLKRYLKN